MSFFRIDLTDFHMTIRCCLNFMFSLWAFLFSTFRFSNFICFLKSVPFFYKLFAVLQKSYLLERVDYGHALGDIRSITKSFPSRTVTGAVPALSWLLPFQVANYRNVLLWWRRCSRRLTTSPPIQKLPKLSNLQTFSRCKMVGFGYLLTFLSTPPPPPCACNSAAIKSS